MLELADDADRLAELVLMLVRSKLNIIQRDPSERQRCLSREQLTCCGNHLVPASPKGDRVQVLADVGDHQVHVRAGELQVNWARANGASTRRKALDGVRPKRFDSLFLCFQPTSADDFSQAPFRGPPLNHPLRVMPLAIWLTEHGRISDVED